MNVVADTDDAGEGKQLNDQSDDHVDNTAAVIIPENGVEVKFVPDGKVSTVNAATDRNGPADVPSTSVDVVIPAKAEKQEKAKEEKPKVVGYVELVTFFCVYSFLSVAMLTRTVL